MQMSLTAAIKGVNWCLQLRGEPLHNITSRPTSDNAIELEGCNGRGELVSAADREAAARRH